MRVGYGTQRKLPSTAVRSTPALNSAPLFFGDTAVIEAVVPVATSMDFPVKLASWSSGRATLAPSFYGYRECRDGLEHVNPRRGVNPLDRSKWILWARGAYQLSIEDR